MPKSPSDESTLDGEPLPKRSRLVEFEPIRLPSIGSATEIESRIYPARLFKALERLRQKDRQRRELEGRIEAIENERQQEDEMVCVVNSCWNKFDEEVKTFLQRFDPDDIAEVRDPVYQGLLTAFKRSDSEELSETLQKRVESSARSLSKLVASISSLSTRRKRIIKLLKNKEPTPSSSSSSSSDDKEDLNELVRKEALDMLQENARLEKLAVDLQTERSQLKKKLTRHNDQIELLENRVESLQNENKNLRFELEKGQDREEKLELRIVELVRTQKTVEPAPEASKEKESSQEPAADISDEKLRELQMELDENSELATSRLAEIEDLTNRNKSLVAELEEFKQKSNILSSQAVKSAPDYQILQVKCHNLMNECKELNEGNELLKKHIEDIGKAQQEQLQKVEEAHQRDLRNLRLETRKLNEELGQVRLEYNSLNNEYQMKIAAHDTKLPNYNEMVHIIDGLKNQNSGLQKQAQISAKALKECQAELQRVREESEQKEKALENSFIIRLDEVIDPCPDEKILPNPGIFANLKSLDYPPYQKSENASPRPRSNGVDVNAKPATPSHSSTPKPVPKPEFLNTFESNSPKPRPEEVRIKEERNGSRSSSPVCGQRKDKIIINGIKHRPEFGSKQGTPERNNNDHEITQMVEKLKEKEKKIEDLQLDIEVLKEKVALLQGADGVDGEKLDLQAQIEALRKRSELLTEYVKKFHRLERRERGRYFHDDFRRRVKTVEVKMERYRKEVYSNRAQCEALMAELENTVSVYEDQLEQNKRMGAQLDEKDETILQLTGERLKCANNEMKLNNEKVVIMSENAALKKQAEDAMQLCKALEQHKKAQDERIGLLENDLKLKSQALDSQRRKTLDAIQEYEDLKVQLSKYGEEVSHLKKRLTEKATILEGTGGKIARLKEDKASLKRKLDQFKKMKRSGNMDEVLMEENKVLREQLNCPSCKTHEKDTVLTKCYHVFCFKCIRTRYDQRRRKCPKCNANFGANDFHRIYIS
ncbi:unnamed protein product [Bursaphelenchus xylophilus]|uniref:E3 ubiquitin protein ligase n=1 Tax=Bursaphelenchus xylophilus TaxID=6326 RepID=A0A1I7SAZ2_BURXY|nr:unnamed protein product [Bursaphelenchus xylophilus]CAG9106015.1 unnamed protein product [Bursaphelenchus xylophilus]